MNVWTGYHVFVTFQYRFYWASYIHRFTALSLLDNMSSSIFNTVSTRYQCVRFFSIPSLLDIMCSSLYRTVSTRYIMFIALISSYSFIVYYSRTFIYTVIILSFIRYTFSNTISWTVYNALNLQSFPNYPENLCNNGIKWKPRSNYKIAVNRRTHATQWKRWSEAMKIWQAVETVNWYFAEMVRQSDEHMLSSRDGVVKIW
jgi:hypothetical protein